MSDIKKLGTYFSKSDFDKLLTSNKNNMFIWYDICRMLNEEKIKTHNYTTLQKIMITILKVVKIIVLVVGGTLIPVLLMSFIAYIVFTQLILPPANWLWEKIRTLVCWLMTNVGFDVWFISFWPFRAIFNSIFGDIWGCTGIGEGQFDIKYGTCLDRFGGTGEECYGGYATDYTLWASGEGSNNRELCKSQFECPNAPENQVLADSNSIIEFFAPVITKGISKGSAPYKYLECCKHPSQRSSCFEEDIKNASDSTAYTNGIPIGYNGIIQFSDINFVYGGYGDTNSRNHFKPLNMYQATKKYFDDDRTWNFSDNQSRHNCKNLTRGGLMGLLGGNWLDKILFSAEKYKNKLRLFIYGFILILIIIQIYDVIMAIKYGRLIKKAKEAKDEKKLIDLIIEYTGVKSENVKREAFKDASTTNVQDHTTKEHIAEEYKAENFLDRTWNGLIQNNSLEKSKTASVSGKSSTINESDMSLESKLMVCTIMIFSLISVSVALILNKRMNPIKEEEEEKQTN